MIKVDNLTKKYRNKTILNEMSFEVEKGNMFVIVGPKNSGKTTIMKLITGFEHADSGSIFVDGINCIDNIDYIKTIIGYVPEGLVMYGMLTVREYMKLFIEINKMKVKETMTLADNLLAYVGLDDYNKKHIKKLTKGQQIKLAIAGALLKNPKLLLLDDPFTGLNEEEVYDVKNILDFYMESGGTILMTLESIQLAAWMNVEVGIIDNGDIADGESYCKVYRNVMNQFEQDINQEHYEGQFYDESYNMQYEEYQTEDILMQQTGEFTPEDVMMQQTGEYNPEDVMMQQSGEYNPEDVMMQQSGEYISEDVMMQQSGEYIPEDVMMQQTGEYIPEDVMMQQSGEYIPEDVMMQQTEEYIYQDDIEQQSKDIVSSENERDITGNQASDNSETQNLMTDSKAEKGNDIDINNSNNIEEIQNKEINNKPIKKNNRRDADPDVLKRPIHRLIEEAEQLKLDDDMDEAKKMRLETAAREAERLKRVAAVQSAGGRNLAKEEMLKKKSLEQPRIDNTQENDWMIGQDYFNGDNRNLGAEYLAQQFKAVKKMTQNKDKRDS